MDYVSTSIQGSVQLRFRGDLWLSHDLLCGLYFVFCKKIVQLLQTDIWRSFQIWCHASINCTCKALGSVSHPTRRLIIRPLEVSRQQDWWYKLSHRCEIWQAPRQQCCGGDYQFPERSGNSKYKFRGFETSLDLTTRRLIGYWNGALVSYEGKRFQLPLLS